LLRACEPPDRNAIAYDWGTIDGPTVVAPGADLPPGAAWLVVVPARCTTWRRDGIVGPNLVVYEVAPGSSLTIGLRGERCAVDIYARLPNCVGDGCPPIPDGWWANPARRAGAGLPSGSALGETVARWLESDVVGWLLAVVGGALLGSWALWALVDTAQTITGTGRYAAVDPYDSDSDPDSGGEREWRE